MGVSTRRLSPSGGLWGLGEGLFLRRGPRGCRCNRIMPALEKQTTLLHAHDTAREAVVMEVKEAAGAQSLTAASAALDEQARKVFVSPRVVDERSFEQLASTLRALTTEAANQGKSLAQASEGVRSLSENLRGLTKDLATKTDQATKVMPVLETRVASAQQLIDRVTRDTAIVKAREARDAISAQIAEQSATWKQQFVQEARESVMSQATAAVDEVMAQHAQSMIASKVQAAVDAAIEAAVRQAVRDALATLKSDVQESVQHAVNKQAASMQAAHTQGLFPQPRQEAASVGQSSIESASRAEALLREGVARAQAVLNSLEAASSKAQATGTQLEHSVEAVAGEISQQLSALRNDALVIVGGASARIEGAASTAAEHAAKQALAQAHEMAKSELLSELTEHVAEILEPELTKQEAATIEAIQTAQHAAHEQISTLVANAEDAARSAAERLGAVVVQAREMAVSLEGRATKHEQLSHDVKISRDTADASNQQNAQSVLQQLQEQTQASAALLTMLSDRVEAAAHATDNIVRALEEAKRAAEQAAGSEKNSTASETSAMATQATSSHGQIISHGQVISHEQVMQAMTQLTHLLGHAAQAGQWLQSITQQARMGVGMQRVN